MVLNLIFFLAALGHHCFKRAFSSCGELGLLSAAVLGLLNTVASLAAEHSLYGMGPVVVAHGLSGSGIEPCPLLWQADSYPLHYQVSMVHIVFKVLLNSVC